MPRRPRRKATRGEAQRAEFGIGDLVSDATLTYRQAAKKWNVRMFMLRARIEYRFGSLAEARALNGYIEPAEQLVKKSCMVCRKHVALPKHRYICDTCTARNDRIHEGIV